MGTTNKVLKEIMKSKDVLQFKMNQAYDAVSQANKDFPPDKKKKKKIDELEKMYFKEDKKLRDETEKERRNDIEKEYIKVKGKALEDGMSGKHLQKIEDDRLNKTRRLVEKLGEDIDKLAIRCMQIEVGIIMTDDFKLPKNIWDKIEIIPFAKQMASSSENTQQNSTEKTPKA